MAKVQIKPWDEMFALYNNYHLDHPSADPLHPTPPSMPRTLDDFIDWMAGNQMIIYPPFKVKIGEIYSLDLEHSQGGDYKVMPTSRTVI